MTDDRAGGSRRGGAVVVMGLGAVVVVGVGA
jgi:hypothetical protein